MSVRTYKTIQLVGTSIMCVALSAGAVVVVAMVF